LAGRFDDRRTIHDDGNDDDYDEAMRETTAAETKK
jgi:hypothetical protein